MVVETIRHIRAKYLPQIDFLAPRSLKADRLPSVASPLASGGVHY